VVVVVLDESSRFDRWSLNGYERETNPLLAREDNLVMLKDVITPVSATRLSVPVIISRKPAMQSLKDGFSEKSFVSAFKEAGFKTFWISNQVSFSKFYTPVSVNYAHCYPQEFDRWQPGARDRQARLHQSAHRAGNEQQLRQRHPLHRLIPVERHWSTEGQRPACLDAVRGRPRIDPVRQVPQDRLPRPQHAVRVPSAGFRLLFEQLRRHRKAKLSTENMFHTVLDMADIRYPAKAWNAASSAPAFMRQKRYVDSYGWTDYDDATMRGDCREVIAKGKPLKRR